MRKKGKDNVSMIIREKTKTELVRKNKSEGGIFLGSHYHGTVSFQLALTSFL